MSQENNIPSEKEKEASDLVLVAIGLLMEINPPEGSVPEKYLSGLIRVEQAYEKIRYPNFK